MKRQNHELFVGRATLHDLEKMNLIRKIHLHESGESFEFQDNIAQFLPEYAAKLCKMVKNLEVAKKLTLTYQ